MQYIHSVLHNLVYYVHHMWNVSQDEVLEDLGFRLFGTLDESYDWTTELITFGLLTWIIVWMFVPFVVERKDFYLMFVLRRYLMVVSIGFIIRAGSFLLTILPSPGEHCAAGHADYNPPLDALEIFLRIDAFKGCGDLIFSSHTAYTTATALTYFRYGNSKIVKVILGILVIVVGCLIVALRKHYSVDVWLAWTIIPLIWVALDAKMPDTLPEKLIEFEQSLENSKPNAQIKDVEAQEDLSRENSVNKLLEG